MVGVNAKTETTLKARIPELARSRQLIVVTSDDWDAARARLERFERKGTIWTSLGPAIAVVVGRQGMAWGIGLHGSHPEDEEPVKAEGDGRAPAGVFALDKIFGDAKASEAGVATFPYMELTPSTEGVEDCASRYYNRVVDAATVRDKDWKSYESMLRPDNLYQWGVVVEHNWKAAPCSGSCIFLHIWRGAGLGTAGCTAMPHDQMESIVHWLDRLKVPLLVQMPAQTYESLRTKWRLPEAD